MNASSFQFKQFTVKQERCAMKVGTDGVLLGAWVRINSDTRRILDVGSGTGLIALMMAQRCPEAEIDGVELDPEAFEQGVENFEQSPWELNLFNYHSSFQHFAEEIEEKYDLIISNPPFFNYGDRPESSRKMARDFSSLPIESLVKGADKLLAKNGRLALILPVDQEQHLLEIIRSYNFFPSQITKVRSTAQSPIKRILVECSRGVPTSPTQTPHIEELIIECQRHQYTKEYRELVSEFYLKM
jgi:tRNA1Val (adenine37-N6)-methyltransferase